MMNEFQRLDRDHSSRDASLPVIAGHLKHIEAMNVIMSKC